MAFYVPLGPRGMLFRLGTFVIGIWGGVGLIDWRIAAVNLCAVSIYHFVR